MYASAILSRTAFPCWIAMPVFSCWKDTVWGWASSLSVCLSGMPRTTVFLCIFHGEVWAGHWLQEGPLILFFNTVVSKEVTKPRGLKWNQIPLPLVNQSCSADGPWKGWKELQHLVFFCFIFCRCVCQHFFFRDKCKQIYVHIIYNVILYNSVFTCCLYTIHKHTENFLPENLRWPLKSYF